MDMTGMVRLCELQPGKSGTIVELTLIDEMRRRLQDIGFIKGTRVECIGGSPLGDPTAFLIKGAVIALRSEDAGRVLVECQG